MWFLSYAVVSCIWHPFCPNSVSSVSEGPSSYSGKVSQLEALVKMLQEDLKKVSRTYTIFSCCPRVSVKVWAVGNCFHFSLINDGPACAGNAPSMCETLIFINLTDWQPRVNVSKVQKCPSTFSWALVLKVFFG